MKAQPIPVHPKARRKPITINANISRVITRPYIPSTQQRIVNIINRVIKLSENEAYSLLENILHDFSQRHRYLREILAQNFEIVARHIPKGVKLSQQRRLLIGAYFTAEYSVEAAALFNPSIVKIPNESNDCEDMCRFILSFRATGEGHISSIEFRSGYVDSNYDIYLDAQSNHVRTPRIRANASYDRRLFWFKLIDMGVNNKACQWLLADLPESFTFSQLQERVEQNKYVKTLRKSDQRLAKEKALWLAHSNYEIQFREEHQISERVIFPVSQSESRGIEDARFVRFVDDDGAVIYYATYTAFDGETILPQLIETRDFVSFKISTLNGTQACGKGMALFPRKINGQYVMMSRQDGENNAIMFSDNLYIWQESKIMQTPQMPHEFYQIGNAGSPIETTDGWLLITHGVGAMRTYSLGIELLDLQDPTRVISRIGEPILIPNEHERDGYVPNVVYSCGAMLFKDELIIPYASADQRCSIAFINLNELMSRLQYNKIND